MNNSASLNIHRPRLAICKEARARLNRQRPCVIWLTGLSGSGKSSSANFVEQQLHERGCRTYLLDGDNIRHNLNRDLGFSSADRAENIRRAAEVAKLMVDAGLIVLVCLISPFRAERDKARSLFEKDEFIEVFIDVPLSIAEQRDPKGLYQKARSGLIQHFTGIDSPYEVPELPEIHIETSEISIEAAAEKVISFLRVRKYI